MVRRDIYTTVRDVYSFRHISTVDRYSAPALIAAALAGLLTLVAIAQNDVQDFKTIRLGGQQEPSGQRISWLDTSPDGSTVAVTYNAGFPLRFYPMDRPEEAAGIDVGNWYEGSRGQYSTSGRYMLLQQLFYLDHTPNKDHPIKFEVIDVATGSVVQIFENIYAAALTPDDSTVLTLDEEGVKFTELTTGKVHNILSIDHPGNAIAVSMDGKRFAVAHQPRELEMAALPSVENDTDPINLDVMKGQVVEVYDMATMKSIYTLSERIKQVFRLQYSTNERDLFIHAKPFTSTPCTPNPKHSYVLVADALFGEMQGISYPTSATCEPDFRTSPDGSLFAIGSACGTVQEVHLYDRDSGKMLDRFVVSRLSRERMGQDDLTFEADMLSFVFLPDNKRMLITSGDRIIEWTYKR